MTSYAVIQNEGKKLDDVTFSWWFIFEDLGNSSEVTMSLFLHLQCSGLYYKTITIVIDAPSVVNYIYGTGVIYERHLRSSNDDRNSFIIQATG